MLLIGQSSHPKPMKKRKSSPEMWIAGKAVIMNRVQIIPPKAWLRPSSISVDIIPTAKKKRIICITKCTIAKIIAAFTGEVFIAIIFFIGV